MTVEFKLATLNKSLTITYFKSWANGRELLESAMDSDDEMGGRDEAKKKGWTAMLEGWVEREGRWFAVLSDRLDNEVPSSKHHYLVPVRTFGNSFSLHKVACTECGR